LKEVVVVVVAGFFVVRAGRVLGSAGLVGMMLPDLSRTCFFKIFDDYLFCLLFHCEGSQVEVSAVETLTFFCGV
jgi:hypothetical protein